LYTVNTVFVLSATFDIFISPASVQVPRWKRNEAAVHFTVDKIDKLLIILYTYHQATTLKTMNAMPLHESVLTKPFKNIMNW